MERIIGRFEGEEKGPLLICFGGIHGNEPAGVMALDLIFKMIEVEPITNPSFKYRGRVVGLVGNMRAYARKMRFIHRDLNRLWDKRRIDKIMRSDPSNLVYEELELKELMEIINREIEDYKPEKLIVLDLHTTSSFGGIFAIVDNTEEGIRIAKEFHAPVVLGMLDGLYGTTLHFFNTQNFGIPTYAVTFESGQHNENLSVNRAIASIINCMASIGALNREDVENRHDSILQEYSRYLPKVTQLVSHHRIRDNDGFKMLPNFKNFQVVYKGQHLANDNNGPIHAEGNGMILMPLYQDQGEDGFFIVKELNI